MVLSSAGSRAPRVHGTEINTKAEWSFAPNAPEQSAAGFGPKLEKLPNGPLFTAGPSGEQTPRSTFEISAHVSETPRQGGHTSES